MEILTQQNLPLLESGLTISLFQDIRALMTPKLILERTEFEKPFIITPNEFVDHQTMLGNREDIRDLKLVPVKDDATHRAYNNTDKDSLLSTIMPLLDSSDMVLAPNLFPYWLPADTDQRLLWIKEKDTSDEKIFDFIARCVNFLNLPLDSLILFERPLATQSKLVKGSFPHLRHIHFWFKK
jgi:hypothetical protein